MGEEAWTLPDDLDRIRSALLDWYQVHKRELPWRETTDPYPILVAEVMSQQTQLERVNESFVQFMKQWPTIEALASAQQSDVVAFWSEARLGYNRRARYLHRSANLVLEEFQGEIPADPEQLQQLPGVGPYTANAVASFAFNNGSAVVDTNVKRILFRAFQIPDDGDCFKEAANRLMPPDKSECWNNAIMELGGLACDRTPRCDSESCPMRRWCEAYASGDFRAPDVPSQSTFSGSRRQYRGRIIRLLQDGSWHSISSIGPKVRVDYGSEQANREWLIDLIGDLVDDGLLEVNQESDQTFIRLAK